MRRWTAVQCRAKRKILEAPSTRGPGPRLTATDAGQLRATIQHHPNGPPEFRLQSIRWAHFMLILLAPNGPNGIDNPDPRLGNGYPKSGVMLSCLNDVPLYARGAELKVRIHLGGRDASKTDQKYGVESLRGPSGLPRIIRDYFLNVKLLPPRSFLTFRMPLGASKDLVYGSNGCLLPGRSPLFFFEWRTDGAAA